MLRCGNLNGNNITYDSDITNLIYWIANQWIISWFEVTSWTVQVGKAVLYGTRTNWEIVAVSIENTTPFSIDTSGTKKVYLTINQAKLDDGSENNVDGTGIVSVATGANYPSSNCIKLASISGWVIIDERVFIKYKALSRDNIEYWIPYRFPWSWYKLGRLKTIDNQRFKMDLVCWIWYGWYGGSAGSEVKINGSSIWSAVTWSWVEIWAASWITAVVVKALWDYQYDLYIYIIANSNPYWKILLMFEGTSWCSFFKEYKEETPPEWGFYFDKIVETIDFWQLSETTNPASTSHAIIHNWSVNFKTSLVNLVKWLFPTSLGEDTWPSSWYIVSLFNWSYNIRTTLANLVKGLWYATPTTQWVVYLPTDNEAVAGTSNTLPITVKQAKDLYAVTTHGSQASISASTSSWWPKDEYSTVLTSTWISIANLSLTWSPSGSSTANLQYRVNSSASWSTIYSNWTTTPLNLSFFIKKWDYRIYLDQNFVSGSAISWSLTTMI